MVEVYQFDVPTVLALLLVTRIASASYATTLNQCTLALLLFKHSAKNFITQVERLAASPYWSGSPAYHFSYIVTPQLVVE